MTSHHMATPDTSRALSNLQRKRRTTRREITVARHTPTPFAIYLIVCEVNWSEIAQCTTHYSYCYYYLCSTFQVVPIPPLSPCHQVIKSTFLPVHCGWKRYYVFIIYGCASPAMCIAFKLLDAHREQRARQSKERPGFQPGQLAEPKLN